jgi:transposase
MDVLERQIAALDAQLRLLVEPCMPQIEQLESIPGVDATAARDILGEMGTDMSRCGSAARVASWAKSSPGHNASAGKRRPGRTGKGNRYVRRIVVQWAWTARKTSTLLGRPFRRLEARVGGTRAAVAVGHTRLVIAYHLLWQGPYDEEQRDADQRPQQEERDRKRAIKALERLGYRVTVDRVA